MAQFSIPPVAEDHPERQAEQRCQLCRLSAPAFVKAVAYGAYQGHLRSLVHLLKYDGMLPVARGLGKLLAASLETLSLETLAVPDPSATARPMLVVPVPMYRAKQRQRGFNHALLLARAALAELHRSHPDWQLRLAPGMLERTKATASQAGLTTRQRRKNLQGAFRAPRPAQLAGQHVLLVDDVYTTGATARACSRVLVAAGAASVRVATVARAQREGVAFWDAHFTRRAVAQTVRQDASRTSGYRLERSRG
jgi:ComF family protein